MIAIVHSIYSQSVHAPAQDAGLMDNDAERYFTCISTASPQNPNKKNFMIKFFL